MANYDASKQIGELEQLDLTLTPNSLVLCQDIPGARLSSAKFSDLLEKCSIDMFQEGPLYGKDRWGISITQNYISPTFQKSFILQPPFDRNFYPGIQVRMTSTSNPNGQYMTGKVVSFVQATGAIAIQSTGAVGSGTLNSWYIVAEDLYNPVFFNQIMLTTSYVPASATATGTKGTIVWDANYIYVCTATNTWKRSPLTTWP